MPLHSATAPADVPPVVKTSNAMITEANPSLQERVSLPHQQLAPDPVPPDVAAQLIRTSCCSTATRG